MKIKTLVSNRRGLHQYQVLQKYEAGMVLTGGEVKSLRLGRATLTDSFAHIKAGEIFWDGAFIAPYQKADQRDYNPKRSRKLLLNKYEIKNLKQKLSKGLTIVPIRVYTSTRGLIKIEIALVKGKKKHDKREAKKKKELQREIKRIAY